MGAVHPGRATPPAAQSGASGQVWRASVCALWPGPQRRGRPHRWGWLGSQSLDSTSLGDAASYRLNGCLDSVLDVKLGEDAGDVVGDGVRAQREVSCDLVVALAAGELPKDLELAVRQGGADGNRSDGA